MQVDIDSLKLSLSDEVREATDDLVTLRREIHRFPELGFQENRTQKLVLDHLAASGIRGEPMAGTGVTALIEGSRPGPVLLIRADMDALPVDEACDIPWKSEHAGVMHACGHDAHTAMLLTAARIIAKGGLDAGAVRLMFQPAEEGQGGALAMINAGILEHPKVDAALGFHVWSGYDTGLVVTEAGPVAASVDGFRLTVHGKGAHAATPEDGIDPVVIASQIITTAQSLVTRRKRPVDPVVLSFTAVNGGSAFNVIPEKVEILGTFRTFDEGVRTRLRADLIALANAAATPFDAKIAYETISETIPVFNDPELTALARATATQVVGAERILIPSPLLVGEDFGEVLHRVPGTFVVLGCGDTALSTRYPHHHPRFNVDERALPIGVEIAVRMAYSVTSRGY